MAPSLDAVFVPNLGTKHAFLLKELISSNISWITAPEQFELGGKLNFDQMKVHHELPMIPATYTEVGCKSPGIE
jgi:hypothetical protein